MLDSSCHMTPMLNLPVFRSRRYISAAHFVIYAPFTSVLGDPRAVDFELKSKNWSLMRVNNETSPLVPYQVQHVLQMGRTIDHQCATPGHRSEFPSLLQEEQSRASVRSTRNSGKLLSMSPIQSGRAIKRYDSATTANPVFHSGRDCMSKSCFLAE